MHRKKAYRSIRKHGAGIRQSVSVSAFFDEDDVHHFRTHAKKLRALLRWLGKDERTLPPSFKEIYRISGQLRDVQVLLKSMEDRREDYPAFAAWLRENASRLQQLWDDKYDPAVVRRLERRLREPKLKKPTAGRLQSFFNQRVGKIESIVFLPAPADEDLHDIRKELKDAYFVYAWGQKNDCAGGNDQMPAILQQLGERCGEFNDRRIALVLLAAYLQQEQEPDAHKAAEALREHWEEERLSCKRALLKDLRAFAENT
ncbi:CHAD domain-containing protein [Flavitalea sp. BT771]|uniref:CHAD domain-containing protein n=1 Tax=Flavitalea sp. BT771 TaxID=3063329 RepID=UPI0026E1CC9F|nr:CHAD domain-containing protein [Flavitalea sp. BT771]MDO6430582.1 CHAD domain-containing protein [Flavitalea sp. BT771]MDV6219278.1 CHAD domain-containing protein [Flavitalea sp. BT771]